MSYKPEQIVGGGADYAKDVARFASLEELENALEYLQTPEFIATRRWSKTLQLTVEREIRKRKREAEKMEVE